MGLIYAGVPEPVVQKILMHFPIENFVETGTYVGDTAFWASRYFKNVFTIEKSPPLWEKARNKYRDVQNINFLFGDSGEILRKIKPQLNTPAMFWLDAHWSGGMTYGEGDECALLRELEAIIDIDQNNFILIDDARLFLLPPPRPHSATDWPNIGQITGMFGKTDRYYTVVIDDVIVASPKVARPVLLEFYQDCATVQWESWQTKNRIQKQNWFSGYINRLRQRK